MRHFRRRLPRLRKDAPRAFHQDNHDQRFRTPTQQHRQSRPQHTARNPLQQNQIRQNLNDDGGAAAPQRKAHLSDRPHRVGNRLRQHIGNHRQRQQLKVDRGRAFQRRIGRKQPDQRLRKGKPGQDKRKQQRDRSRQGKPERLSHPLWLINSGILGEKHNPARQNTVEKAARHCKQAVDNCGR